MYTRSLPTPKRPRGDNGPLSYRYGHSHKADWSISVVFDRLLMMDGCKPVVVAQWYGNIDMDLLAWKAAQFVAFYDNYLLVIESNTTLVKVIREGLYVERDKRCIDEYLNYEKKPNGSFDAKQGTHDDLLMKRAIGLHICFYEMELPQVVTRGSNNLKYVPKVISAASF